jgi:hypothetical protein
MLKFFPYLAIRPIGLNGKIARLLFARAQKVQIKLGKRQIRILWNTSQKNVSNRVLARDRNLNRYHGFVEFQNCMRSFLV